MAGIRTRQRVANKILIEHKDLIRADHSYDRTELVYWKDVESSSAKTLKSELCEWAKQFNLIRNDGEPCLGVGPRAPEG